MAAGAPTVTVKGTVTLVQLLLLFLTVRIKLYVPAALAGIGTVSGLVVIVALLTAVNPLMALGEPVVMLY